MVLLQEGAISQHPLRSKQAGQSLPTSGSCSILPDRETDALNDAIRSSLGFLRALWHCSTRRHDFIRGPPFQKRCRRPLGVQHFAVDTALRQKIGGALTVQSKPRPTDSFTPITNSQSEHSFGTRPSTQSRDMLSIAAVREHSGQHRV
jgi:hypothetical protein